MSDDASRSQGERLPLGNHNHNHNHHHHHHHHHHHSHDDNDNFFSASSFRNDSAYDTTATTVITMDHTNAPGDGVDGPAQEDRDGAPELDQGQQQQQQQQQQQGLPGPETTATTGTADANEDVAGDQESRGDRDAHDEFNASLLPPPLPDRDDNSLLLYSSDDDGDQERAVNQTLLEEKEMRHKLMDMESSFLPEPSTVDVQQAGVDDTFLLGVPQEQQQHHQYYHHHHQQQQDPPNATTQSEDYTQLSLPLQDDTDQDLTSTTDNNDHAPQTPRAGSGVQNMAVGSTTPATHAEHQHDADSTIFENVASSSSPTADAAARSVTRIQPDDDDDNDMTDNPNDTSQESQLQPTTEPLSQSAIHTGTASQMSGKSKLFSGSDSEVLPRRRGNRPKYLNSRQSAQRLSHSSVATSNTDVTATSDTTLGLDYALQTGGAAPEDGDKNQNTKGRSASMARSVSLGSVASGISGYSDENTYEKRNVSGATDGGLHTLEEEDDLFLPSNPGSPPPAGQTTTADSAGPTTPKPKQSDNNLPTDTAIAERVKDVQVPSTFARQFREDLPRAMSPEKQLGTTSAFGKSGRNMTLKEQSSTIDRLSKENFDLKVRIHFLNESLNKRSEEGIKEMISENVELKSDKLKLQKDNQGLKRKLRDLEKELKDQSDRESMLNHDPEASDEENHRDAAQNEEVEFLRERVETYESEVERLRSEGLAKETEKRRLAEMVKSLNDGRQVGSEVGSREERDMWKDMLDVEIAAREHSERENRKLREETERLRYRIETSSTNVRPELRESFNSFDRQQALGSSKRGSSTNNMEVDLLKQENSELRKEVSAQASMLTSRNREKERLYQEIEELKLANGGRSVAGDSIFDRSASRAQRRSPSEEEGESRLDDEASREEFEVRNGQLRDKISSLKLENHTIREQLEEYVRELEAVDAAYQADVDLAGAELNHARKQRDQALQMADERDAAFQELRAEAQEELDGIGEELDQKVEECQRLNEELRQQEASLHLLQAEVRAAGEGILRLEEDSQHNLERYQTVQQELADSNHEIQALERSLREANSKVQQLTVQIESSQNEISFLREEQDGDKIKIGDLESELKTYEINLSSEKDKTRELEGELMYATTHHQALFGNFQKDSERTRNDLNRQALVAKDEVRSMKKTLSAQEVETNTWRERLTDLENNLREALGDLTGSRSSLINNIVKLQKELESTALELESTRSKLDEKESILRNRDSLLESHGLESRKLSELLDRERHGRRADKQSFEQALKSQHQASRTITHSNSRISELELAYKQDRKRFAGLEQQFKDQLSERNAMLLTIWKRLSAMCGPDWAHSNSLINGNLPSQEVIGNILFWPGFSRNLMLAVKTVEAVINSFKNRIKGVERDLTKQYHSLEHTFSQRVKKLDRMEESVMNMRAQNQAGASPELAKLRGENRLLKAELNLIQTNSPSRRSVAAATGSRAAPTGSPTAVNTRDMEMEYDQEAPRSGPSHFSSATTLADQAGGGALVHGRRPRNTSTDSGNERWIQRLRELEKRLKAEREARLLDRGGARKRLEERDAENQRLRDQVERQETRTTTAVPTDFGSRLRGTGTRGQIQYPTDRTDDLEQQQQQQQQQQRGIEGRKPAAAAAGHEDDESSEEPASYSIDIEY